MQALHLTFDQVVHFLLGALVFGGGTLAINFVANNPERLSMLFEGDFAANALRTGVNWSGWEWIWGAILLVFSAAALYFLVRRQVAELTRELQAPLRHITRYECRVVIWCDIPVDGLRKFETAPVTAGHLGQ